MNTRRYKTDPGKFGFKIWDGPGLSKYIHDRFGIELGIRQCQRLFHDLGYSRIRPQPYPSKGYEHTELRDAFKKKRSETERDSDLILAYQDEVHFQRQTTVTVG